MKNIKRLALLVAVLMMAFSMLLLMASCGDEDESDGGSTQPSSATNNNSTTSSSKPSGTTGSSKGDEKPDPTPDSSTKPITPDSSSGGSTTDSSKPGSTTDSSKPGDTTDSSKPGSTTDSTKPNDGIEDEENPNLVKVTVLNQLGKPVSGATVQICQGETCFFKKIKTGSDGTGSREYSLGEGVLKAKVDSIEGMADYLAPADSGYVYFDEGSRELVITIQKITVNVVDDTNKAVEGAAIQLYQGKNAFKTPIYTDAAGVAYGFIALSGEEISCVVTEIAIGSGYELDNKPVVFDNGVYETEIVVAKNATYSVKISTLLGEALKGAKVELYDVLKNRKQKTVYTDANGVAKFENMDKGEYYFKVIITSPAYVIVEESVDGKYYFAADSVTRELSVVEYPEITYTVKVSNGLGGQTVNFYNVDNELIGTQITDETGVATFMAPNGSYTAVLVADDIYATPAYFVTDDSAVGEIKVTTDMPGSSKDNPIVLVGNQHLTLSAGQTVWFAVPNGHRKIVTITASGVTVSYNEQLSKVDDVMALQFTEETGAVSYFSVTTESETTIDVSASAPGTHNNPIDITEKLDENGSCTEEIAFEKNLTVYYTYTATNNGTLSVTINDQQYSVHFDGDNMGLISNSGEHIYPVSAGETVLIAIDMLDVDALDDTGIVFSFGEEKVDYTITVNKDGDSAQGIVVILYAKNGEELVEIARGTTLENGQYVFEGVDYSHDYVVKVEYPEGYTSVFEQVELGVANYGTVVLSRIKTGEPDAPFDFDALLGEETAEVKENGTVWYTIYVRPSNDGTQYKIYANSANAVIKIYNSDTNDDGIIDSNDTPVGVSSVDGEIASYIFNANNMLYTIAVSTADGSAESISLVYEDIAGKVGASTENAIEITEAGTYTATVDGEVYYRYTGDRCKLTVTLNGEANLGRVLLSMDGMTIEDAENNVLVVEDTEGGWIYFVISSDMVGDYEFTVTVE